MNKLRILIGSILIGSSLVGCSGVNDVEKVKDRLSEYMQAVYAPSSMDQFKEAKEECEDIFTGDVKNRFFVSYADELSQEDLLRRCDTIIIHGEARNQSDGRERYVVKAYLYEDKYAEAIVRYFTFYVNEDKKIYDFTIETKEQWESIDK